MSLSRVGDLSAHLAETAAQRQFMRHRLVRRVQDNTHLLASASMVSGLLGFPHYLLNVDHYIWLAQLLTYLTFVLISYNLLLENGQQRLGILTLSVVTMGLFVVQLTPYAADFNDTKQLFGMTAYLQHEQMLATTEYVAGALLALLISISYLLQRWRQILASQAVLTVAIMIPLIPVLGFLCGISRPYGSMAPLASVSGLLCASGLLAKHASQPPMSYLLLMDDTGKQIRASILLLSLCAIMLVRVSVLFEDNARVIPVMVVLSLLAIIYTMMASYYRQGRAASQVLPATDMDFASQVEHALDNEQFHLVYQPQMNVRTGQLKGVEALVRWEHPTLGMISPAELVRVSELTGLIVPLGKWILRTACAEAVRWKDDPVLGHVELAVNVSALQLKSENLLADVLQVLAETGFPAERLVIELTESAFVEDGGENASIMRRLKQAGVKLAIDDFGTGYSCLSYLRDIPGDYLKVDRSFVMELPGHNRAEAVIQAIVSLGKSLGYQIIAEGIETDAQAAFLQKIGCDIAQGFLLATPMSAQSLRLWAAQTPMGAAVTDLPPPDFNWRATAA